MPNSILNGIEDVNQALFQKHKEKFNPDQVDEDIARIQEGKRVVREVDVGNQTVVLRNLKLSEADIARNMGRQVDAEGKILRNSNGEAIVDEAVFGRIQLYLSIYSISGKDLTAFPGDLGTVEIRQQFEKALEERREWIEDLPPTWVRPVVENNIALIVYVEKLSDPKTIANF